MKYKTKLKHYQANGIVNLIETLLTTQEPDDDEEKLLFATLREVAHRLTQKLVSDFGKNNFTISFSPAHAMALRLLFTGYVRDSTTYIGNCLHTIANGVDKAFV